MRFPRIRYLDWAKRRFDAQPPAFNLASSGMQSAGNAELGLDSPPFPPVSGLNSMGHAKLAAAIAAYLGVAPDRIVSASGTTQANFLVQAALVEPGDEVLCEWPAYEPLWRTLESLGARVSWLERRAEHRFVPDLAAIASAFARGVKLLVLSDLHNPTAAPMLRDIVSEIGRLALRHDAWVLVDEVYLSGVFPAPPASAATLGERLVTTGSLTKTFGLGALRAGWIAAPPALVARIYDIADHVGASRPYVADELALRAFERLDALHARARRHREENYPLVEAACREVPGLELHPSAGGFIAWARLPPGFDADLFVDHLFDTTGTLVVPGAFFGRPDHVRLGFGLPREVVAEGLARFVRAARDFTPNPLGSRPPEAP